MFARAILLRSSSFFNDFELQNSFTAECKSTGILLTPNKSIANHEYRLIPNGSDKAPDLSYFLTGTLHIESNQAR